MQECISINASDISMRESDRLELKAMVKAYLKTKKITVLKTSTAPRPARTAFNAMVCTSPEKQRAASIKLEESAALVRSLLVTEIEGVKTYRTATEISKIMRAQGCKLGAPSVRRIAERMGLILPS